MAMYADRMLGLNGRQTEERLRVGRALAELPVLDGALGSGELSWSAVRELNLPIGPEATPIVVVENTPSTHNVVVCTLCSCYPSSLLGLPPTWYKSPPYRARVVREPRAVLREMGLDLPRDINVSVWDSSAEVRYLVLPERPANTDGWSEERLASLVTRDALIGVAKSLVPSDD